MSEDYLDAACPALSEIFFVFFGSWVFAWGGVCESAFALSTAQDHGVVTCCAHLFMFGRVFSLSSVAYARYENIKPDHRSIRTQSRV